MFLIDNSTWKIVSTPNKGRGVYAKKEISPGIVIGDYLGKLVYSSRIMQKRGTFYDMEWNHRYSIYPDLKSPGVHLINHSCEPNCAMYPYKGHTLYIALRRIFPGEELTVQYLLGTPDEEDEKCLDTCHCGSPFCHGTMHNPQFINDAYIELEEQLSGEYFKKIPVKIGEYLSPLKEYPDAVPDYPLYDLFGSAKKSPLVIKEKSLPNVMQIRKLIRESGKQLEYPLVGFRVSGILRGHIVGISFSSVVNV